ncbi:MAG: hypothetical protein AAB152_02330 [Candidatus Coatesbacteria bacterium]
MLALALLLSLNAAAEPPRFSWPQTRWEARLAGATDGACEVRALAVDGRDAVIVAGTTSRKSGYAARAVPLVAKIGAGGRRLWEQNALGRKASPWGEVRLAVVHESREITAHGSVGDSADDPLRLSVFARYGPDGTIQWTRTLTVPGLFRFEPVSMTAVPGGDLVLAGTGSRPEALEVPQWCVVRVDARLGVRWFRTHDQESTGEATPTQVVAGRGGDAFVLGVGRIGLGPKRWLMEGWGPAGERRMGAWGDGDANCLSSMGRRIATSGRGFLVAGDEVCTGKASVVFVKRLDREGRVVWEGRRVWEVTDPTMGRVSDVVALPSGGMIAVGEERTVGDEIGVTWPLALRWNAEGDLMMTGRGLLKQETTSRYTVAALDSEGNLVVAGESTALVKGVPVRRIFVRKMAF